MKRNPNSNRSKKWIERNSLSSEKCLAYLKDLFGAYGVQYKICGDKLLVGVGETSYRVYFDYENVCIIVVNKENGEKKRYEGDSCWIDFVFDVIG